MMSFENPDVLSAMGVSIKGTLLRDGTDAIDYPLARGSFGITYQAYHTKCGY
ncbi:MULTISPECIES: hypothetical protein [Microcystis]|uniref:hypothetical protein n=2 Tax=Microcystis TaxID=1125 RepID=UPI001C849BF7|nr:MULTISPECIES: hypothetical protein [Microcystis]